VLNPFTPFGDCSLTRHGEPLTPISRRSAAPNELQACLDMVHDLGCARLMNAAELTASRSVTPPTWSCSNSRRRRPWAVAELAQPLMGWKGAARRSFTRSVADDSSSVSSAVDRCQIASAGVAASGRHPSSQQSFAVAFDVYEKLIAALSQTL